MAEETGPGVEGSSDGCVSYKLHTLFDVQIFNTLTKGIKIANCLRSKTAESISYEEVSSGVLDKIQDLAVSDTLMCSFCCVSFDDQIQQRQHYKLDWHRYNLKQNLEGKKPVSEEKFDQLADDVSSISGSDTEEEDLSVENVVPLVDDFSIQKSDSSTILSDLHLRQPKLFFENEDGNIISLYKCVLYGKKDVPEKEKDLISLALECQANPLWAVFMLGGGHFAAAIFEGTVPVVHKTFHCYTVRASQGGAQGSRDSKSATSHPKSAGASLRRYNEASLIQHVQDIVQSWSEQLGKCSRIFWRAAGPHNQSVLFGGKMPPLSKSDPRLRSIPFPTRRPTFFEVQRVHKALSSLEIYGKADNYVDRFPVSPRSNLGRREKKPYNSAAGEGNEAGENGKDVAAAGMATSKAMSPRKSSGGRVIDRAKPRKSPSRPLPEMVQALATAVTPGGSSEEDDEGGQHYEIIVPTLETFENHELGELGDGVSPEVKEAISEAKKQAKKAKRKKAALEPQPVKKKEEVVEEFSESLVKLAKDIRAACEVGDVDLLNLYVASASERNSVQGENGVSQGESTEGLVGDDKVEEASAVQKIQRYIFEDGNSILHAASAHGDPVILRALLEAGFDPSLKNKKGQPPYAVSAHKEMRNTFRRFMAAYPDRYDYTKAQVPGPLTEELEKELENRALEKKRLARKAKKESKKAKIKEEEEKSERERFLSLSEREKRALAAERRLLERSKKGQGKPVVISRCYQCAVDITGKIPFEYDVNRFCSMDCLKLHRAKSKPAS
ncbi:ankyrin repeat and zinc finger domain-containing protein 1-like [Ischnura elegans]|uniref:ankyrin repeat and zinc finger domain-containing protein 1-like n=1 Tax=Ischnura elegans TaxID=197161 RepID=UPI001ED8B4F7|nr:ankyrin repeat and zinc finger domain-containing protein 1-like [Ischnura elegans]